MRPEDDQTFRHGTKTGYERRKCKCEKCREWKSTKERERRAKNKARLEAGDQTIPHGTEPGYSKFGCRCQPCRDVYSARMKEWDRLHPLGRAGSSRRWRQRVEAELVPNAAHLGDVWTGAELEIVVTRRDLTAPQLARMLKRTVAGVYGAKHRATTDPKWMAVVGVADATVGD